MAQIHLINSTHNKLTQESMLYDLKFCKVHYSKVHILVLEKKIFKSFQCILNHFCYRISLRMEKSACAQWSLIWTKISVSFMKGYALCQCSCIERFKMTQWFQFDLDHNLKIRNSWVFFQFYLEILQEHESI